MLARLRLHELPALHSLAGQRQMACDVLLLRRPYLLILVGVNQRADALVGKHLGQQPLVLPAVDDVDARDAGPASRRGMLGLGQLSGAKSSRFFCISALQLVDAHLAEQLALHEQAVRARHVDRLDRFQRIGDRHRRGVGIHPVGLAVAVEPEWRHDRDDALREEGLEQLDVHPLDLAGEHGSTPWMIPAGRARSRWSWRRAGRWRRAPRGSCGSAEAAHRASCSVSGSVIPVPSRSLGTMPCSARAARFAPPPRGPGRPGCSANGAPRRRAGCWRSSRR